MIILEGAVYGKLYLNSTTLTYKSLPRTEKILKHQFGSPSTVQIERKICKRWELKNVSEIVVKRYNLIRQAVELYFNDSTSVFISFFRSAYRKKFMKAVYEIYNKRKEELKIDFVSKPEKYIDMKKYAEKWAEGLISNFEYLMLLNKYGGRSFHDVRQYPIFPWIISNYEDDKIDIENDMNYRDLSLTIAGISEAKRKQADDKLENMKSLQGMGIEPYQIGAHCLPGRIVLGFLFRIEPYSSLLLQFEHRRDEPARMFHVLGRSWISGNRDALDNKELVPEFYYSPTIFYNDNRYLFGAKKPDTDISLIIGNEFTKVRVDQVVLPKWAKTGDEFIKMNALALEDRYASQNLHKWIDLLFGYLQQDHRVYNLYKPLTSEDYVRKKKAEINESNIVEIQEFGSIPIQLFKLNHPERKYKEITERLQHGVFYANRTKQDKHLFGLLKICSFDNNPICYIKSYLNQVFVVLSNQQVIKSKESYINEFHDKGISFTKSKAGTEFKIHPHKSLFSDDILKIPLSDLKRAYCFIEKGKFVISANHYDNTCKILDLISANINTKIMFHKSLVTTVFLLSDESNILFTGSSDGVLAKWDLKMKNQVIPQWFYCDLDSQICTLDANKLCDIVAVGSENCEICVRLISTGKFLCRINLIQIMKTASEFKLKILRISFRGYIIAIFENYKTQQDLISVTNINGDLIKYVQTTEKIFSIVLDESGYYFITGGSSGKLMHYDLITLNAKNLLTLVDAKITGLVSTLSEFLEESTVITSLELTPLEGCQQLLIGTNKGNLYSYRYSPRIIGKKIYIA